MKSRMKKNNSLLTKKCSNWFIARQQRKKENQRGEGKRGVWGFSKQGCYECNGRNLECKKYIFIEKIGNLYEDNYKEIKEKNT